MSGADRGILTVVSGFAGSGKGTVMKKLIQDHAEYALSVSATSRAPREGEKEGVSYFFKTRDEFEEMIRKDEFLEYAEYVGNYYGTPADFVYRMMDEGKDVILEIELQGAMQVKKKYPEAVLVFLTPPDANTLYARLKGRGTETDEVIAKRMRRAAEEASLLGGYDYIVVNDEVDLCAERIHGIIKAAHHSVKHEKALIDSLTEELRDINL